MPAESPSVVIDLVSLREQLQENAFLFEQPQAYSSGVDDALRAVEGVLNGHDVPARGWQLQPDR
ncbi:MAG TPA: hypothetical protein VHF25_03220 [Nitriliruptorales bacterium]|nr:hypothetical protein [Nitriliruptorales bacterium]